MLRASIAWAAVNSLPSDSKRRANLKKKLRDLIRRIKSLTLPREERRHSLVGPAKLWRMKRDFQIGFFEKSKSKA